MENGHNEMRYEKIVKAKFVFRQNRFVAEVTVKGTPVLAHVKNTGRCRELLVAGSTVYLEDFKGRMRTRKMRYDLVAVEKGNLLINMDSQAPNKVVEEALVSGTLQLPGMEQLSKIKAEEICGNCRLDFFVRDQSGKEGYAEIKGVTLEKDGVALFPDAPTERGIKHLNELKKLAESGYSAYVIFVVQMEGMQYFEPNYQCHVAFGRTLQEASESGVKVLAYECRVAQQELTLSGEIPVHL